MDVDHSDDELSEASERVAISSTTSYCIEPVTQNKYTLTVSYFQSYEYEHQALEVEASIRWIPSHRQKFTNIALVDNLIHSFVSKKEETEVGSLEGTIIHCPNGNFFDVADSYNSELINVAMQFCDSIGRPTKIKRPEIKAQEESESGDFFHIYMVEIDPDHSGRDLGVRMVYEALKMDTSWTLAVLVPGPLGELSFSWRDSNQKFFRQRRIVISGDEEEADEGDREEERRRCASKKVCLQFARLGFVQAGRNPDDCDSWFLTKQMFDDVHGSRNLHRRSSPNMNLISKDEVAATVDVYFPPKPHKPSKIDRKLVEYVRTQTIKYGMVKEEGHAQIVAEMKTGLETMEQYLLVPETGESEETKRLYEEARQTFQNVHQRVGELEEAHAKAMNDLLAKISEGISEMLADGASLDGSRVLYRYAANVDSSFADTGILKILVAQGASINLVDEMGVMPIHVAAASCKPHVLEFLLSMGADPSARDLSGKTTADQLVLKYQMSRDQKLAMGLSNFPPREIDCVPLFESAKALMSKSQPLDLKGGVLPPRMLHMLSCTANLLVRSFEDIQKFDPALFGNDPELAMQQVQKFRLHFIPIVGVQFHYDPPGEYWRILLNGYKSYWKAISDILQSGQGPTVDNVRRKLEAGQNGSVEMYECWTGIKIEYTLDALFDEASKAYKEQVTDEKVKELPESPLDEMYDVLWCMCVRRGGGEWEDDQSRGPFKDDWREVCEVLPEEEVDSDEDNDEEEESLADQDGDGEEDEEEEEELAEEEGRLRGEPEH